MPGWDGDSTLQPRVPTTILPEANGIEMANTQLGGAVTVITPIKRTGSLRCVACTIGELRSQGWDTTALERKQKLLSHFI